MAGAESNFLEVQPTVFIVDDDPEVLASLSALVTSMGFSTRCYSSGQDYLASFDPEVAGCLILDLRMPAVDGVMVLEALDEKEIAPSVIVLTGFADVPSAVRAVRLGAVAFLQKQSYGETELWEAIQSGVAADAERRSAFARKRAVQKLLTRLSEPERHVLEMLLRGADHTGIAESLGISRRTVESRRARLMRKLEVTTFTQLIRLTIEAGLFPAP